MADLTYTLSLDASAFVATLEGTLARLSSSISRYTGGLVGLSAGVGGFAATVRNALNFGSLLSDLSAQLTETPRTILVLRQAFEEAGLGADYASLAVMQMRRALGGVNEDGEPTHHVLQRLKLDLDSLRSASAIEQLTTVGQAIMSLATESERANAAVAIFGRSGARMLALFRDMRQLESASVSTARLGAFMDRYADAFDRLSDRFQRLRLFLTEVGTGMAEKLMPLLDRVFRRLEATDWISFGRQLGTSVEMVASSFSKIANIVGNLIGGPHGVGVLLSKFIELRAALLGLDVIRGVGGLFSRDGGEAIATGFVASASAKAGVIGSAIAAAFVTGAIAQAPITRFVTRLDEAVAAANRLVEARVEFEQRLAGVRSVEEWQRAREDLLRAIDETRRELYLAEGSRQPEIYRNSLQSHLNLLGILYQRSSDIAGRDAVIAANRAADAAKREAAARAEQLSLRVQLAPLERTMLFLPDDLRRVGETVEAYEERLIAQYSRQLDALQREYDEIVGRANAQQLTKDIVERGLKLAEQYEHTRRKLLELQVAQWDKEQQRKRAEEETNRLSGFSPTPLHLTDRWARLGLMVGSPGAGLNVELRRMVNTAEKIVHKLADIERILARRGELLWQ